MNFQIATNKRALLASLVLFLGSTGAAAGLLEVKQTVFGMDCAPCAHGLEKGLEKLEGVKDASVSLNEGYAAASLDPGNPVTIEQIRQVVRDNGFTPKEATVVIAGTLGRTKENNLALKSSTGQEYNLIAAPQVPSGLDSLQTIAVGEPVKINGVLSEGATNRLAVLEFESAAQ